MKRITSFLIAFVFFASVAVAGVTSYQVTGPVLELKDNAIIVQKGKEKWEIARDKDTKISGDVAVGAKVTIHYTMKATSIEVKGEKKK